MYEWKNLQLSEKCEMHILLSIINQDHNISADKTVLHMFYFFHSTKYPLYPMMWKK